MNKGQAAILAGGFGTRLQSQVSDRNKVAADVNGKPFIEYLLNELAIYGFDEVIICSGYKHDDLLARLGHRYKNLRLKYSIEKMPLGTAGALRHAFPRFTCDTIVVLNGDSFCSVDFHELLQFHKGKSHPVTLTGVWVDDASRYGTIVMDDNNKLLQFNEKQCDRGGGYINAGVYVISSQLIATVTPGQKFSLEIEVFPQWVAQGYINVYTTSGPFIDIGTPKSYLETNSFMHALQSSK